MKKHIITIILLCTIDMIQTKAKPTPSTNTQNKKPTKNTGVKKNKKPSDILPEKIKAQLAHDIQTTNPHDLLIDTNEEKKRELLNVYPYQ